MQLLAIVSMKTKDYLKIGKINEKSFLEKISIENYQEALEYMNRKN